MRGDLDAVEHGSKPAVSASVSGQRSVIPCREAMRTYGMPETGRKWVCRYPIKKVTRAEFSMVGAGWLARYTPCCVLEYPFCSCHQASF